MSLRAKQRRAVGNSQRPGGNALEHGGDTLTKLKNMTGGQDASRRCARRLGGPDHNPFSVRASMQTDQDGPFASAGCIGPLEMPLRRHGQRHKYCPVDNPNGPERTFCVIGLCRPTADALNINGPTQTDRGRPIRSDFDQAGKKVPPAARRILTLASVVMQKRPKFGRGLRRRGLTALSARVLLNRRRPQLSLTQC
jgi:hypothetical protein